MVARMRSSSVGRVHRLSTFDPCAHLQFSTTPCTLLIPNVSYVLRLTWFVQVGRRVLVWGGRTVRSAHNTMIC